MRLWCRGCAGIKHCWRWWWEGGWWRQTRSPEVGNECSRSSGVCLPCRCTINRCRDLRGSQTHHKHHIKDELINAHPDVNYHKTKTLKHWFFLIFNKSHSCFNIFSNDISQRAISTCDGFIIYARALFWPFQACEINAYVEEPYHWCVPGSACRQTLGQEPREEDESGRYY